MVGAVGPVGQLLHEHVVERPQAHADGGQPDVGPLAYLLEDVVGAGGPHVGHAVGQQQDQNRPVLIGLAPRHLVAAGQPRLGVGAAPGRHPPADLIHDLIPVAPNIGGLENGVGVVVVGDDAHPGAVGQARHQEVHRPMGQGHPLDGLGVRAGPLAHRAGPVHHQHHGLGDHHVGQGVGGLHAHPHQHLPGVGEGGGGRVDVDEQLVQHRPVSAVEVVDELLDPHRFGRRQPPALEMVAGHDVGRRVHVQGEGGERVLGGVHHRVVAVVQEDVGPAARARRAKGRGRCSSGANGVVRAHVAHFHGIRVRFRLGRRPERLVRRGRGRCGGS